jgi:phosphatidylglycerophosphate synthase
MAPPFVVVLLPPPPGNDGEAYGLGHAVAGVSTPLRLALTAQSAGARAVHLAPGAETLAAALQDPRRTIPFTTAPPPDDVAVIEVAAHVVVHRGLFQPLVSAVADGRARAIGADEARVLARPPAAAEDGSRPSGGPPIPFVFAPPFGFAPIAVTSPREASRAVSALLRSLRKTVDGWTSTHLNRYISLACTRLLVHTGIRPNQLSVGILFIGLASGIVAAKGDYASLEIGAALLKTQSVLDGCDGELSRLTFRGSRTGEWLDTIGDDISNYGFFGGASYGLYRATGWMPYLVIGAIIVGCGLLTSGLEYRYLLKIGSGDLLKYPLGLGDEGGKAETGMARVGAMIRPLFKRDTFVLLTLIAAIAKLLGPMLAIFAAGAIGITVAVIKAELRMARERRAKAG